MREIKFRGFCNIEKKMYQNFYIEDHTKFAFMNELIHAGQRRYTMLQYTGLKDKNDVEICEGDVVENVGPHSATVQRYGFKPFNSRGKKFVVTKELVGFTLRHVVDYAIQLKTPKGIDGLVPNGFFGSMPPIDNYQFWNCQSSFEIIGNIYENPELIGEE